MARSNWEADKTLDVYIHDYLVKRNLLATAKVFVEEGKVCSDPVAIDNPSGFLLEWWSIFWDTYQTRMKEKAAEIKSRDQLMQLQRLTKHNGQMQLGDANVPVLNGQINAMNSGGVSGPTLPSGNGSKAIENQMRNLNYIDHEGSSHHVRNNAANLISSPAVQMGATMISGNSMKPSAPHQIQSQNQQANFNSDILYGPAVMQAKIGLGSSGVNQGVTTVPFNGWTVPILEQSQSNFKMPKQMMPPLNQFQLLSSSQQSPSSQNAYMMLGSLAQPSSPKVRPDQAEYLMKQKMQLSLTNQQIELQQQQLSQQSARKRKLASAGAGSGTAGNSVAQSPASPSVSNVPVDVTASGSNLAPKSTVMYDYHGTSGLDSLSAMDLDNLEMENVDLFFSSDEADGRDITSLKRSPECNSSSLKGFSLSEVSCNRMSNNKVVCCHFTTDGKLLASAGHDKKVILLNTENFEAWSKSEECLHFITDVRFRPNSNHLATSSYDGTIRLWNASDHNGSIQMFTGHNSHVLSLDFHPTKTDVLCSSDDNGEVRFWTIGQNTPSHITKMKQGNGGGKVRFQPRVGSNLAVTAGKFVNIFDVEKDAKAILSLEGHLTDVQNLCWDENGDILASVSQDVVKVWSASGECVNELKSNGNKFHSCSFHPRYPKVLIIGGYQCMELWNMADNSRASIQAHEGLIAALASSLAKGFVASTSHDKSIKIWK